MFPAWRALSSGPVLGSVGPNEAIASFGAEEGATRGPGEEPASTGSIVLIRTLRLRRDNHSSIWMRCLSPVWMTAGCARQGSLPHIGCWNA